MGACCDPDTGACTEQTETDCLTLLGQYLGDGTDCTTAACPGTGRCCRDLGQTCDIRTEASCTGLGSESWIADATCLSSPCPIPPDNDNCSICTDVVTLPFVAVVDTTDATTSNTGHPGSCNSPGAVTNGTQDNDVWWCYTPAEDCVLTASGGTDDYDAIFVVYFGSSCAVAELVCIDEPDSLADPATATFVATAGVTYYFQMGDYGEGGGGGGLSTFNLDCVSGFGACCFCDTSCQE
ncbi:MAG: hypothetical protein GY778_01850, partial [bacterium]|nr:hypothetical protein [bacterium]